MGFFPKGADGMGALSTGRTEAEGQGPPSNPAQKILSFVPGSTVSLPDFVYTLVIELGEFGLELCGSAGSFLATSLRMMSPKAL